jgi:hypothetical protein
MTGESDSLACALWLQSGVYAEVLIWAEIHSRVIKGERTGNARG